MHLRLPSARQRHRAGVLLGDLDLPKTSFSKGGGETQTSGKAHPQDTACPRPHLGAAARGARKPPGEVWH